MIAVYICNMGKLIIIIICLLSGSISCSGQISEHMKSLIKDLEGLSTEVYMDGEEPAVGYGHHLCHTKYQWVRDLEPGDEITAEMADLLFDYDMLYLVTPGIEKVKADLGPDYPVNVYDVMGSVIYNIGLAGLIRSDFYRLFKKGDYERAFTELLMLKSRDRGVYERRKKELRVLLENYDFAQNKYRLR